MPTWRARVVVRGALCAACLLWWSPLGAQQLLERVVARVNGIPITLSDVNAAMALGLVDGPFGGDPVPAATAQLIDRQLMLAEVARFAPPEPDSAAVDAEVGRRKARIGSRWSEVTAATGLDDDRLRDVAREVLLIQAYLDDRFGLAQQVGDAEVERYYSSHAPEFTRNGTLMPFEEAEPVARARAAAQRRSVAIAQWLHDLYARAEVVFPPKRP